MLYRPFLSGSNMSPVKTVLLPNVLKKNNKKIISWLLTILIQGIWGQGVKAS